MVDLNGDRQDDIVVGVPLYSLRKEEGAVYVFLNKNEVRNMKMCNAC